MKSSSDSRDFCSETLFRCALLGCSFQNVSKLSEKWSWNTRALVYMGERNFTLLQWSVSALKYGICLFPEQNYHVPNMSLFLQLHWSHCLSGYKLVHFTARICYVPLGDTDRCFHDVLECVPNHLDIMEIIIWPLTLVNYFLYSQKIIFLVISHSLWDSEFCGPHYSRSVSSPLGFNYSASNIYTFIYVIAR